MVDGAKSEWIPIVSGMPQGSVLGPLLLLYLPAKCFELVENRLFAYADDSTLLTVVGTSLNMDLARIQEWFNHWCMILNLNKTQTLVVSRSVTLSPTDGDLALSGVSIRAGPQPRHPWREV